MKDIVVGILATIIAIVIIGLLLSVPVMFLWNWVMPDIFNVPQINLGQALALSLLSCCLFNSGLAKKK